MELRDFSRVLTLNKEQAKSADRLIGIAQGMAPAMLRTKATVVVTGSNDLPFINDPDADPLISLIASTSPLARLLAAGAPSVPVNTLLPVSTLEPTATWTVDGTAVPLSRITSTTTTTRPHSNTTLVAVSKELIKHRDARGRTYILAVVRGVVSDADGEKLTSADAGTEAAPAGLLNGLSAVSVGSPDDLQLGLEAIYAQTVDGKAKLPVFILSGRAALYLLGTGLQAFKDLTVKGGTIGGAPAIITPGAGANLLLVDASALAISDNGLEVSASDVAAMQFVDNPTNSAATGTATNLVSAWQTNYTSLKVQRFVSWAKLRSDACAFLELPIGGSPS